MASKNSSRNDLIHLYLLNVEDIYYPFRASAKCVAKRIAKGAPINVETLANSSSVRNLQTKLNLYSLKHDGVKCVECGDRELIAKEIIEEAKEITKE